MEDRQTKELSSAIRAVASAITSLGLSIMFGLMYVGCTILSHH